VSVTPKLTPGPFLRGLVLGHGGEAAVEGPEDVAEELKAHARALDRLYA